MAVTLEMVSKMGSSCLLRKDENIVLFYYYYYYYYYYLNSIPILTTHSFGSVVRKRAFIVACRVEIFTANVQFIPYQLLRLVLLRAIDSQNNN